MVIEPQIMSNSIERLSPRGEFFLVIGICFTYYIAVSLVVLLTRMTSYEMTPARVLRGIAVELAILLVFVAILFARKRSLRQLAGTFTVPAALGGIPLAIAYYMAYLGLFVVVVTVYPDATRLTSIQMRPAAPFWLMAIFIVINSLYEETTVAAYVVTALSEQGAALSITASTLLRFLYHLYQGPIATLSILPLGILCGAVYWRWRNVWPLVVAHTILNFLAFSAAR